MALAHVAERLVVDHVIVVPRPQQRQKRLAGFRPTGSEDREALASSAWFSVRRASMETVSVEPSGHADIQSVNHKTARKRKQLSPEICPAYRAIGASIEIAPIP